MPKKKGGKAKKPTNAGTAKAATLEAAAPTLPASTGDTAAWFAELDQKRTIELMQFPVAWNTFDKCRERGDTLYHQGNYKGAYENLRKALDIHQTFLSNKAIRQNFTEDTRVRCNEVSKSASSIAGIAAACLLNLGMYKPAEELIDLAEKLSSNFWGWQKHKVTLLKVKDPGCKQAREFLLRLLNWGHAEIHHGAAHELLKLYYEHDFVEPLKCDLDDVCGKLKDLNDVYDCYMLGMLYYKIREYALAGEYFSRQIALPEHGQLRRAEAYYRLALTQLEINNPDRNIEAALHSFSIAIDMGHEPSIFAAAVLADQSGDLNKAFELYQKASAGGDINATYNVACSYFDGEGVTQDREKAVDLFLEVTKRCSQLVIENMGPGILSSYRGALLELGNYYSSSNPEAAKKYWYLCAETGDNAGFYALMDFFSKQREFSEYVEVNERLLKKEPGNKIPLFNMGVAFLNGHGVEENIQRAIDYFEQAARLGMIEAFLFLCTIYYDRADGVLPADRLESVFNTFTLNTENPNQGNEYFYAFTQPASDPEAMARRNSFRQAQSHINVIARDRRVPPELRIKELIEEMNSAVGLDQHNFFTLLTNIATSFGELTWVDPEMLKGILGMFDNVVKKLGSQRVQFSANDLCILWKSIGAFNVSLDHPAVKDVASILLRQTEGRRGLLTTEDKAYIFSRMTQLLPCKDTRFNPIYIELLNDCISISSSLEGHHLSLFFQNMIVASFAETAVFDSLMQKLPDLNAFIFRVLEAEYVDAREMRQVFLGLKYISSKNFFSPDSESAKKLTAKLVLLEGLLQGMHQDSSTVSSLQARVTRVLREIDSTLGVETLISTLPVDIVTSTGQPIQVHGPSHYLLKEGFQYSNDSCDLKSKDAFLAEVIGAGCQNKPVIVIPFFAISDMRDAELKAFLKDKLAAMKPKPTPNPHTFHAHQPPGTDGAAGAPGVTGTPGGASYSSVLRGGRSG